jgi:spindle assembly abnormal protein 6
VLDLLLTDPSDPFFFYSLSLTESDFSNLRKDQGIIVDFAQLAGMIGKLADKCIQEDVGGGEGKFHLMLDCGSGSSSSTLNFQEVNDFRHLCHLSLQVGVISNSGWQSRYCCASGPCSITGWGQTCNG